MQCIHYSQWFLRFSHMIIMTDFPRVQFVSVTEFSSSFSPQNEGCFAPLMMLGQCIIRSLHSITDTLVFEAKIETLFCMASWSTTSFVSRNCSRMSLKYWSRRVAFSHRNSLHTVFLWVAFESFKCAKNHGQYVVLAKVAIWSWNLRGGILIFFQLIFTSSACRSRRANTDTGLKGAPPYTTSLSDVIKAKLAE